MKSDKHIKWEYYDRLYRDHESKKFYQSAVWRRAREWKLRRDPCCQTCAQAGRDGVIANLVHHMIPIKKGTKKLDLDFLVSLCHACHNQIESELEKDGNRQ